MEADTGAEQDHVINCYSDFPCTEASAVIVCCCIMAAASQRVISSLA